MFIAIPTGMNYRTERLPVVTLTLIGVNTLVYVITLICALYTNFESDIWVMQHLWLTPSESVWYTYLTSMFVHAGIFHLLGNLLFLFLFGCCVEDMIGRGRFLAFYLLGGLAAEFAYIAITPLHFTSTIPLGGASGAISACMGMYLMLRTEADIEIKYFYFFWLFEVRFGSGEFEIPAWMAIGAWFLENFLSMLWDIYFPSHGGGGGVAFGAHVGGLLAGLAFIALLKLGAAKKAREITSTGILSPEEIQAAAAPNRTASEFEIPTIYLDEAGVQTGPFTLAQIQTRLAQNELSFETRYWSEGMSQWESVKDLASG